MANDRVPNTPGHVGPTDAEFEALRASLSILWQPIVRVATGELFAYEALARFGDLPTEKVIAAAGEAGWGVALELACVDAVRRGSTELRSRVPVSLNMSAQALAEAFLHIDRWPERLDGLIVEVTEHSTMTLDVVDNELADMRARGARLAVDDVGTGYAGLLRIAATRPELVKVDRSIVTGVATGEIQSAVMDSLVRYSHRIGAQVIAEGVETEEDLNALARLDVDFAQGWLVGRPQAEPRPVAAEVVALCRANRAEILARTGYISDRAHRARDLNQAVSMLSLATELAEIRLAIDAVARASGVDNIVLSGLGLDGTLREVFASGAADTDPVAYRVSDFPTTEHVLRTGEAAEVHVNDRDGDLAEQRLLSCLGAHSLLIVPFSAGGKAVGILEFFQRVERRWTTVEIEQARGLALHLGTAWERMLSPRAASVDDGAASGPPGRSQA